MSKIYMSTQFLAMSINVETETVAQGWHFWTGGLMSKLELELNVNSFEHRGINVNIAAPGRAREGDRLG